MQGPCLLERYPHHTVVSHKVRTRAPTGQQQSVGSATSGAFCNTRKTPLSANVEEATGKRADEREGRSKEALGRWRESLLKRTYAADTHACEHALSHATLRCAMLHCSVLYLFTRFVSARCCATLCLCVQHALRCHFLFSCGQGMKSA